MTSQNKTVLITGANRGLGLALCKEFAQRGFQVFGTHRRPFHPDINGVSWIKMDVADFNSVYAGIAGRGIRELHVLINNAAVLDKDDTFQSLREESVKRAMRTNSIGPMLVTQALWHPLKAARGRVINISSTDAFCRDECRPAYAISKAALNALTKKLSLVGEKDGIEVCAVHPGWMRTDMGGANALVIPADSARFIMKIVECADPIRGRFFIYGDASQAL